LDRASTRTLRATPVALEDEATACNLEMRK